MKTPLTPSDVEVLIWYHVRGERHPRADAPAVSGAIRMFVKEKMLVPWDEYPEAYRTTRLGHAMVDAICRTPVPRTVFMDESGNILEGSEK